MKVLRGILAVVFTVGMIYSCYRLVITEVRYSKAEMAYENISSAYVTVNTPAPQSVNTQDSISISPDAAESTPYVSKVPASVDFNEASLVYPELRAWLYSEDTPINYPIMQSTDDEYYLTHLPNGDYSASGSLFLSCSLPGDLSARSTVIYGHNMKNGSMFGSLRNYRDQSYYDEHPVMYLVTPDGEYRLDVIAGFDATFYSDVYQQINDWDDLQSYISGWKQASEFVSNAGTDYEKIVVLSTCSTQEDLRFVVICGLVLL